MNLKQKEFCICTYVAGSIYRALAKNLVQDLAKYAPEIPFIIYTDKPQEFENYSNVLAFGHKRQGILHYHERRFAIQKALSMFKSCMYIDSDVRICAPIPNREWLPGITARSCTGMIKHFQERINKTDTPSVSALKKFELFKKMANKLNIDIEKEDVTWINEFLFVVTRDSGKEEEFLQNWEKIAIYAEVNGLHKHPAYAMGLAATKANLRVRHDVMEGVDFFDDRIEKIRISKGQTSSKDKLKYFETQKKIENPRNPIFKKIVKKVNKYVEYLYHFVRLRVTTILSNYNFYYR
ncbi:hypothetical protein Riv7116_5688 [Rivularia sp. PCC 7116]|uniref:hypothetical protein n=1 Tax=Rivularia sp. PCC 7116 TaxID=373994 RepID=UPI00029F0D6A|nr:hypothetical protein [Rivularia sp. PCC 7116]AFY58055.1 hypothetical protein Riv7116_5688 [Rivularia sp. PCC 7116]